MPKKALKTKILINSLAKTKQFFIFGKNNAMSQNIILNHQEIEHKIKRIAYQIYETFSDENEIIIAGISNNGYILAQKINTVLNAVSDLRITLCEVKIDKTNPFKPITTCCTWSLQQ